MITVDHPTHVQARQGSLLTIAWVVTILVSILPDIIWTELGRSVPIWFESSAFFWAKIALLGVLTAVTYAWATVRPLRPYFAILLILYLAEALFAWLAGTMQWQVWFGGSSSFTTSMLSVQLPRLAIALVMIVALSLIIGPRSEFFLVKGQPDAPAAPVRWLGINKPVSWARLGWILSVCITLGLLVFLVLAGRPTLETMKLALPLLPAVLIFAALNAFSENVSYRAALLSPLHTLFRPSQVLLLTAAYFGISHYYGVPYGVIGVVMATFLGWLLSKSMLETKGMLWPWFIHFCQDVAVFSFIAMGSITPGG